MTEIKMLTGSGNILAVLGTDGTISCKGLNNDYWHQHGSPHDPTEINVRMIAVHDDPKQQYIAQLRRSSVDGKIIIYLSYLDKTDFIPCVLNTAQIFEIDIRSIHMVRVVDTVFLYMLTTENTVLIRPLNKCYISDWQSEITVHLNPVPGIRLIYIPSHVYSLTHHQFVVLTNTNVLYHWHEHNPTSKSNHFITLRDGPMARSIYNMHSPILSQSLRLMDSQMNMAYIEQITRDVYIHRNRAIERMPASTDSPIHSLYITPGGTSVYMANATSVIQYPGHAITYPFME